MTELLTRLDAARAKLAASLRPEERKALGQFLTPAPVASLMASMVEELPTRVRLLDAGAGIGALTAAFVSDICTWERPPEQVSLCAYEMDLRLQPALGEALASCEEALRARGVRVSSEIHAEDFIQHAVAQIAGTIPPQRFNYAIINPPYRKIRSESRERRLLRQGGIETSNLYTAFLALVAKLLEPGGVLTAICPRSFCNGPYFLPFRELLLDAEGMSLRRIHEFTERNRAFAGDAVLQEMMVFTAEKRASRARRVGITVSAGPTGLPAPREVPYGAVLKPDDPERVIHVPRVEAQGSMPLDARLPCTLACLGVRVLTGPVVDFRVPFALRKHAGERTVPLLYAVHLGTGQLRWPVEGFRKPQHLVAEPRTEGLLLPLGPQDRYILVKRFTSKEQRRRVVAAECRSSDVAGAARMGVENHVNVLTGAELPLAPEIARGLCGFLNSTVLDEAFRQFSGHTQVNAGDLRRLRFPSHACLAALGRSMEGIDVLEQAAIDNLVAAAMLG